MILPVLVSQQQHGPTRLCFYFFRGQDKRDVIFRAGGGSIILTKSLTSSDSRIIRTAVTMKAVTMKAVTMKAFNETNR
jgi:hypothetical protein